MRLFLRGSSVVFAVVSALAFILAPAASADQLKAQTTVGSNLPVRPCLFVFSDTAAAQSTNVITMRCFFPPLCRWPVLDQFSNSRAGLIPVCPPPGPAPCYPTTTSGIAERSARQHTITNPCPVPTCPGPVLMAQPSTTVRPYCPDVNSSDPVHLRPVF